MKFFEVDPALKIKGCRYEPDMKFFKVDPVLKIKGCRYEPDMKFFLKKCHVK